MSTAVAPLVAASNVVSTSGGILAPSVGGTGGAGPGLIRTQGGIGNANSGTYTIAQTAPTASGMDATATGIFANTGANTGATAYGSWSNVSGTNGTAIGFRAVAGQGSVAVGYQNQATGNQSIAIGYANVVSGAHSGAIGDPNTVSGAGSYAIGNNNTVSSNNTFVLGNNVVVPIGDNGAVVLGDGSASGGANTVSVGSVGNARRITNVGAGSNGTDAVNLSQLNAVQANLGNQINGVQRQVFDLGRTASFGIAGATALAMIPEMDPGQSFSLGLGVASFNGYQAVGLGFTGRINDHVKVKAGASISGGTSTFGGGVSFGW